MKWERVVFWALATYAIVAAIFSHGNELLVYSAVSAGIGALLFSNMPEAE